MSISAKEARKQTDRTKGKIFGQTYDDIIAIVDRDIKRAIKNGHTHTDFYPHGTVYDVWEDEIKEHYRKLGYTFRPTGVIGGVMQETEDICW